MFEQKPRDGAKTKRGGRVPGSFKLVHSINLERMAKVLPRFLLDEERKKGKCPCSFLNGDWAQKPYN
jgi:seryl-tRNA synthetase